jgi:hypothetical protein
MSKSKIITIHSTFKGAIVDKKAYLVSPFVYTEIVSAIAHSDSCFIHKNEKILQPKKKHQPFIFR